MKIDINNFTYNQNEVILENIHQTFQPATFNLIIGASGEGKTTLLKLIAQLYPKYTNGYLNGLVSSHIKSAYMFQNPNYQFVMATVKEEFIFALENILTPQAKMDTIIDHYLSLFHLEKLKDQKISNLSGGEKQKVVLSILIAIQKDLIILDEPFANVDHESRLQILQIIKKLQTKHNKTIIITDHDFSNYENLITNLFEMKHHSLVEVNKDQLAKFKASNQNQISTKKGQQEEIISFKHLSIKNGTKIILNRTSNKIYAGVTLLNGTNGCGKSTLFNALIKLKDYTGEILINHHPLSKSKPKKLLETIGLNFQNSDQQFLKATVNDELKLAQKKANPKKWSKSNLNQTLKSLNLAHKLNSSINNLSGGQKKKLQFLLMLMCNHKILLLDEPFAGLDYQSIQKLIKLIHQFKNDKSFILISHQTTFLNEIVDHQLTFKNKQIIEEKGQS